MGSQSPTTNKSSLSLSLDLSLESELWAENLGGFLDQAPKIIEKILKEERPQLCQSIHVYLGLILTDDVQMASLNQRYRQKEGPTNVLAFPGTPARDPEAPQTLGDIILSYGVLSREAKDLSLSPAHHAIHLLVHGLLHLLGHDHLEEDQAKIMETKEIRYLRELGIENPYENPNMEPINS